MKFGSIIWLESSVKTKISQKVIEDLNLEGVYERLLSNDEILFSLCQDLETIRFRQEILEDLLEQEGLVEDLVKSLETFSELKPLYYGKTQKDPNLYRIIDIMIIIEKSIMALEEMKQMLDYYPLKSIGLKTLKENIYLIADSKEFRNMQKDLKEIRYIFNTIRSAELSVSMSSGLRPVYAQITSLDEFKYRYPKAFRKVSDALASNTEFLGQRLSNYIPVFKVGRLNYDLIEEIEFALEEHKPLLTKFIETYERIDVRPFISLLDEFEFYKASTLLFKKIKQKELPLTKPTFCEDSKEFKMDIKDLYNINLALQMDSQEREIIVLNDVLFDENNRAIIITGANRGGKTTFTQAIGQIQLLAQLGLFVPAKNAKLSLVDTMITHFQISEKDTYEIGKFGKECSMFVEGFHEATSHSLYLLNESFTGTSHLESLSIATQGCKALLRYNIPFIFNTHLHELYEELLMEVQDKEGVIQSLVTQMNENGSVYKLIPHLPYGKSYARQIASKYGVTFEQLIGGEFNETGN